MSNESAVESAYIRIRQLITDQTYDAGARLKEEELALVVGSSRTPVRQALAQLKSEGLITMTPNRGAIVTEYSMQAAREIFELRELLEPYAAGLAAERCEDEEAVAWLEELARRMEALRGDDPVDVERMAVLNNEFHSFIVDLSASSRTKEIVRGLVSATLVLRTFAGYDQESWDRSLGHHREIIAAISTHDRHWAEAAMRTHISSGAHQFLGSAGR